MMCAAPTRELFSRRTLVRRIQQKLNQVVELVSRYAFFKLHHTVYQRNIQPRNHFGFEWRVEC
ncbi:MAG: hypothetical protein ACK55Z_15825 [bacterium]